MWWKCSGLLACVRYLDIKSGILISIVLLGNRRNKRSQTSSTWVVWFRMISASKGLALYVSSVSLARALARKFTWARQENFFRDSTAPFWENIRQQSSCSTASMPCLKHQSGKTGGKCENEDEYPSSHTNKAPGNGWLGDDPFILGPTYFQRIC